ncbi:cactin, spliceosome C complex subunit [Choristoneura fumiferana]|uniref:cactin, spliceosome C complex subunit n=1 Tax=Choristoneura fumiferana TaxID=7141 RepID=UPI003D155CAD
MADNCEVVKPRSRSRHHEQRHHRSRERSSGPTNDNSDGKRSSRSKRRRDHREKSTRHESRQRARHRKRRRRSRRETSAESASSCRGEKRSSRSKRRRCHREGLLSPHKSGTTNGNQPPNIRETEKRHATVEMKALSREASASGARAGVGLTPPPQTVAQAVEQQATGSAEALDTTAVASHTHSKQAVDCLVYAIDDRILRSSAMSARLTDPEELFKFLKDFSKESNLRAAKRPSTSASNELICFKCNKPGHRSVNCRSSNIKEVTCYNCKEKGHVSSKCTKPLNKCDNCNIIGHKSADCFRNKSINSNNNNKSSDKKTMFAQSHKPDSKFYKQVLINTSIPIKCYIDFGSDCTLVRQDIVDSHSLPKFDNDLPIIRGFGNNSYTPTGRTKFSLTIGEITADVDAYIVDSSVLTEGLLVGQNFTERPEVVVIKTHERLDILRRDIRTDLAELPNNIEPAVPKVVLRIVTDTSVNGCEFVECKSIEQKDCDVFVEDSSRYQKNMEYCVIGGVYNVHDGDCKIAVYNYSAAPVTLEAGSLFVRANVISALEPPKNLRSITCNRIINQSALVPLAESDINMNPKLSAEQSNALVQLVNKYRVCFAQNLSELGCTDASEMVIELADQTPVVYRPYRLSYTERQTVRDMVTELIQNDIAEESNSPYASPVILVSKKNGGHRLCVDFRALNRKTIKDHYPMPRIEDQLDMLNGNKYYSSLDLASGYYQIPIRKDCRPYTAFITPDGLYQFKKMPFGLANSPAVFQRTINKVLGNSRFNSTLAYMDDILIPGKDFAEQLQRLENAFQLLKEAGLTLNLQKCNFLQEELEYLGYEISEKGVKPGKAKIIAVQRFPTPSNVHEVRQFMGLASYFRKFMKGFALIARPLTDLTKKDCTWCWGTEQEQAFQQLKATLTQRPLLGIYDPTRETQIHTDASKYGLGGILMQRDPITDILRPIAYFSRKTSVEEQNYHAYELETLAVISSFQRFRVYLVGVKFTLVTDCSALRATFSKRDLIPRIARWWIALQEFDFDIQYKPGHTMCHVDALSRNPQPCGSDVSQDPIPTVLRITQEDWLLSLQLEDSEIQRIRKILENKEYSDIKDNYVTKGNKLFRKVGNELKWVVPKTARFQLCRLNHDDIGHFSIDKTLEKIKQDFWFPKMRRFITKYVRSCIECAYSKEPSGPKEGLLHPIHKVDRPFDTVHIDHLGPFVRSAKGHSYLLVLVDGFTKFSLLKPLRNLKSKLTIRALEDIFTTFGYPSRLISDRGTSFTSKEFKKYCDQSKIKHILNAVCTPRANGQVERYNRTILDTLTAYSDKLGERNWDTVLGQLQWGLNNTLNKGIGRAPSEAMFGVRMLSKGDNTFAEILTNTRQTGSLDDIRSQISTHIEKDQMAQKNRYDRRKVKARVYKEGELVKILKPTPGNDGQSKKLLPKFTGPFRVTKVLDNDRYEISSIVGSNITQRKYCNIWAADRIKPWITTQIDSSSDSDSDCSSNDN